jgi:hypothetical protein
MCLMAQQVTVQLVDDFDGSKASATVEFTLDGKSYELDLSNKNADKLRKALAPYVAVARKAGRPRRGRTVSSRSLTSNREQSMAVRKWASENGWSIADRGRIPANVIEAYENRNR